MKEREVVTTVIVQGCVFQVSYVDVSNFIFPLIAPPCKFCNLPKAEFRLEYEMDVVSADPDVEDWIPGYAHAFLLHHLGAGSPCCVHCRARATTLSQERLDLETEGH